MPAVLTEIGFISNPEEEDYISSDAGQAEIVTCIMNAVQAYKKQVELQ
jgi:N-acetylmuramoyl-L-alanine amidase